MPWGGVRLNTLGARPLLGVLYQPGCCMMIMNVEHSMEWEFGTGNNVPCSSAQIWPGLEPGRRHRRPTCYSLWTVTGPCISPLVNTELQCHTPPSVLRLRNHTAEVRSVSSWGWECVFLRLSLLQEGSVLHRIEIGFFRHELLHARKDVPNIARRFGNCPHSLRVRNLTTYRELY
jgi:hypothetical protein